MSDRVTLKALRVKSKSKKHRDLGIDVGVSATMTTMLAWTVLHIFGEGWSGIAAGLGAGLISGFGLIISSALLSGMLEESRLPKRWCDAVGYTVGAIGTAVVAKQWYPLWFVVSIAVLALLAFWPTYLRQMKRTTSEKRLGLPAHLARAALDLPKLQGESTDLVNRALQAYVDLNDGAPLLPESERHVVADADASLQAVLVQARIVHRLRRKSGPLAEAHAVARERLANLVVGLEELVAAVVMYDTARNEAGFDTVRERAESLRLLAAAHAELEQL